VVFFGENVPKERVDTSMARLEEADALLVVGSSLMIWSGYRFARAAAERGLPMAAINLGKTRADSELQLKVAAHCGDVLPRMMEELSPGK
jgi:NAD-dependent SIR2 family protein deacetylase